MSLPFIAGSAGYDDNTGTSLPIASTLNVADGDLIVAWCTWEDGAGGTLGCSDGGSNTLTMDAGINQSGQVYGAFGYKLSTSANAAATFTFTNTSTAVNRSVIILQFRPDAGDIISLDPAASNPAYGVGTGTSLVSGNITTLGTDTVCVGVGKIYSSGTWSADQIGNVNADGVVDSNRPGKNARAWYRILTSGMSAGHAQASCTGNNTWVCGVIGFRASQGIGGELLGVSDTIGSAIGRKRAVSDPLSLSDFISIIQSGGSTNYARNLAESLGISDSLYRQIVRRVSQGDNLGMSDSLFMHMDFSRPQTSTIAVSDPRPPLHDINGWSTIYGLGGVNILNDFTAVGATAGMNGIAYRYPAGGTLSNYSNRVNTCRVVFSSPVRMGPVSYLANGGETTFVAFVLDTDGFARLYNIVDGVWTRLGSEDRAVTSGDVIGFRIYYNAFTSDTMVRSIVNDVYGTSVSGLALNDNAHTNHGFVIDGNSSASVSTYLASSIADMSNYAERKLDAVRQPYEVAGVADAEDYFKAMVRIRSEIVFMQDPRPYFHFPERWSTITGLGSMIFDRESVRGAATGLNGAIYAYPVGASYSGNNMSVIYGQVYFSSPTRMGLVASCATGEQSCVAVVVETDGHLYLYKVNAGTWVQMGSASAATVASGDIIALGVTFGVSYPATAYAVAYLNGTIAVDTQSYAEDPASYYYTGVLIDGNSDASITRYQWLGSMGDSNYIDRTLNSFRQQSDVLGITDFEYAQKLTNIINLYLSDSLGLTDSRSQSITLRKYLNEVIGVIDVENVIKAIAKYLTESLGLTDTQSKLLRKAVSESTGITDALNKIRQIVIQVSDTEGISDSTSRILQKLAQLTESLGVTDSEVFRRTVARILSDVEGLSDSNARVMAAIRAMTESAGVSDQYDRTMGYFRQESDPMGMSDSVFQLKSLLKSIADSVGLTDSQNKVAQYARAVSDSLTLTDIINRNMSYLRSVVDSEGVSDNTIRASIVVQRLADALGVTDFKSSSFAKFATVVESLGVIDQTIKLLGKSISDSTGITDSIARQMAVQRAIADVEGITDTQIKLLAKRVADALGITDSIKTASLMYKVISDTLGLTDAQYRAVVKAFSVADSMGITDARINMYRKALADALGLTDAQSRFISFIKAMSEGLGLSDVLSRAMAANRSSADAVGITDSQSKWIAIVTNRVVTETVGLTDANKIVKAVIRIISESLGLTDVQLKTSAIKQVVSDVMSLVDVASKSSTVVRRNTESVGLSDALKSLIAKILALADQVGLTDMQVKAIGAYRSLLESEGVTDLLYRVATSSRYEIESVGVTDNLRRILGYLRSQTESVGLSDSRQYARILAKVLTESVAISDSEFRTVMYWLHQYDMVGLADGEFRSVTYARFVTDLLGLIDRMEIEGTITSGVAASIRRRIMMQMRRQ